MRKMWPNAGLQIFFVANILSKISLYHYGRSAVDVAFVIKFTSDGGTIVAGYTDSKDGDIDPHTPSGLILAVN
jgi:hypothetical protein